MELALESADYPAEVYSREFYGGEDARAGYIFLTPPR